MRLEALEDRCLMSLVPVPATANWPFSAICEVTATWEPKHLQAHASGVLIDADHVLTAAHAVYSFVNGGDATSIIVAPELHGNSYRFGLAHVTQIRVYDEWKAYSSLHHTLSDYTAYGAYDIALLTLDRDIGNQAGYMSIAYGSTDAIFSAGSVFCTAGYPVVGFSGTQMYYSTGRVSGLSPDHDAILYEQSSITVYPGDSGSPVWRYWQATGQLVVYGINVTGGRKQNFATRITPRIYNDIQAWRATDTAALDSLMATVSQRRKVFLETPVTLYS